MTSLVCTSKKVEVLGAESRVLMTEGEGGGISLWLDRRNELTSTSAQHNMVTRVNSNVLHS
jgi:hypothetical protein